MKYFLVADDSPVVRKIVSTIMHKHGFTVLEAENGRQAYHICEKNMPDGIFLDACMPIMGGLDFLEALPGINADTSPAILYCACEIDREDIRKALANGAQNYIVKPFNRDILEHKLQSVGLLEMA